MCFDARQHPNLFSSSRQFSLVAGNTKQSHHLSYRLSQVICATCAYHHKYIMAIATCSHTRLRLEVKEGLRSGAKRCSKRRKKNVPGETTKARTRTA